MQRAVASRISDRQASGSRAAYFLAKGHTSKCEGWLGCAATRAVIHRKLRSHLWCLHLSGEGCGEGGLPTPPVQPEFLSNFFQIPSTLVRSPEPGPGKAPLLHAGHRSIFFPRLSGFELAPFISSENCCQCGSSNMQICSCQSPV